MVMLKDYKVGVHEPDGGAALFAALCGDRIKHVVSDRRSVVCIVDSGHSVSFTAVSDTELRFRMLTPEDTAELLTHERKRISAVAAAAGTPI
jgi:hypothetical protein